MIPEFIDGVGSLEVVTVETDSVGSSFSFREDQLGYLFEMSHWAVRGYLPDLVWIFCHFYQSIWKRTFPFSTRFGCKPMYD